jgi:hypothetical protein
MKFTFKKLFYDSLKAISIFSISKIEKYLICFPFLTKKEFGMRNAISFFSQIKGEGGVRGIKFNSANFIN